MRKANAVKEPSEIHRSRFAGITIMKKQYVVHSVKYNFLMNFILTASNFLFPLITFPYISRILHASGNGKVSFAASIANYFMMAASLGIPTYGIRACAKVRDNKEELSHTAQELLIINLIATSVVTGTYLICIFTVPRFAQDKALFFIEGINIVLNMLGANWIYQALEQYDYITVRSVLFKAVSILLMFMMVHQESDYRAYAATTVIASAGSNIMNFFRLRECISFHKTGQYHFKRHLKPIFVLFAQSAAVSIYTNLDTVMLGFMKTDTDVGLYTAAVKVKGILVAVVNSLGSVLLPRMSFFAERKKKGEFHRLLVLALNAELFMALPLTAYFGVEAKDTLLFLAGREYLQATRTMQIINLAVIPIGLTGVIGVQTLTSLDRENQVLVSVLCGALSDFILNLFMIPIWGASGAALATTCAEYIVLLVQLSLGKDVVGEALKRVKYQRYIFATIIAVILTELSTLLSIPYTFLRLIITAGVFFITYFWKMYIIKDELFLKLVRCKDAKRHFFNRVDKR